MTLIALGEGSQGMSLLAKHPVALFSVCEKHRKCRAIHICEMRKKADFLNSEYSKEYRHASGKIHGHCFFFVVALFETRDILFGLVSFNITAVTQFKKEVAKTEGYSY